MRTGPTERRRLSHWPFVFGKAGSTAIAKTGRSVDRRSSESLAQKLQTNQDTPNHNERLVDALSYFRDDVSFYKPFGAIFVIANLQRS